MDAATKAVIESGVLGALLVLCAAALVWVILRRERDATAYRAAIDALQAARVADSQKTRDDVVAVNRELVGVMTRNVATLEAATDAIGEVSELLERIRAEQPQGPTNDPDRTLRGRKVTKA